MKIQTMMAIVLSAASVSAQAGNWAVKNGWCQTMTENGQALVMLKNDTISIFGQLQGCPNGPQELMGSRIAVNGNLVPTSQVCSQCSGQLKLATALEFFQYRFSDSFGGNPPL